MTQPGRGPTTAGMTDQNARGAGAARMLAVTAAGLAVLFYLLGFLGDVGIATGEVGILLIGGGLLVGASVLPQVGRVLLPGAVAVVVGMLVLLQIVASGGSSGLLVGALVVAFLEALAAVTAFLLDVGLVTPPVPRAAPPAHGQPPTQQWTGQPGGAGAWPGAAPGWPGQGPAAWPPGGSPPPGQVAPPGPAYGQPPVQHPSAAGPSGAWLPTPGPSTAAYERPSGASGTPARRDEATAVFALPPTVSGPDTARIGTPVTPAWGQPAVARADPAPTAGHGTGGSPDDRPEHDRTDVAPSPAPDERGEN